MVTKDINLLPQDLKSKQTEEKVKSSLGNVFLIFLVITAVLSLVSSALLIQTTLSQNQIKQTITRDQSKIKDLGIIENEAQRLDRKILALDGIIKGRRRYSLLLASIQAAVPQEITINNLASFADNRASLSGSSLSYQGLSNFISSLIDPSLGGKVFTSADLTSASLDEVTGRIRFALTLFLKEGGLK